MCLWPLTLRLCDTACSLSSGNGKTITVKAVIKTCTERGFIPLYVKSFSCKYHARSCCQMWTKCCSRLSRRPSGHDGCFQKGSSDVPLCGMPSSLVLSLMCLIKFNSAADFGGPRQSDQRHKPIVFPQPA